VGYATGEVTVLGMFVYVTEYIMSLSACIVCVSTYQIGICVRLCVLYVLFHVYVCMCIY
jgi:hypothetical protein